MLTRSQSARKDNFKQLVKNNDSRAHRLVKMPDKYNQKDYILNDDEFDYNDIGIYEVNIDFDEASAAWKQNKRSTGNGCYTYKNISTRDIKKPKEFSVTFQIPQEYTIKTRSKSVK